MNARRIYAVFLRQLFIIRNLPSRVVPYFLWAVLDVVLWGFITKYLNAVGKAGFSFVPVFLGAVILWGFLQRVQQGLTIPFLEDVWSRNLLNTFASPMKISEYIMGFVLASCMTSLFGLLMMLLFARLLFGLSMFVLGAALLPFLLMLFLFGAALGIIGAAIVLRFGPYAEWFIWPIPAILSPLVGVFYPVSVLPNSIQYISYLLPPTYVFQGMRDALINGVFRPELLLWGFVAACVYVAISYSIFSLTYRIVVRKGLIARFSAEG